MLNNAIFYIELILLCQKLLWKLKNPMSLHVTESLLQKFPKREEGRKERRKKQKKNFLSSDGVSDKIVHILKGKIISILHTFIKKTKMWDYFLTHFMGSARFFHQRSQENYKIKLLQASNSHQLKNISIYKHDKTITKKGLFQMQSWLITFGSAKIKTMIIIIEE